MNKILIYFCLFNASCITSWLIRERPEENVVPSAETDPLSSIGEDPDPYDLEVVGIDFDDPDLTSQPQESFAIEGQGESLDAPMIQFDDDSLQIGNLGDSPYLPIYSDNAPPILSAEPENLPDSYRETMLRFEIAAEDPDNDELTYSLTQAPANGICSLEEGRLLYCPNPGFTGTEHIGIQVSDGQLSDSRTITFPVKEHPNSVEMHIALDDSQLSSDLLYKIYEMNEGLNARGGPLLRLNDEKTENGFSGVLSKKTPLAGALHFDDWIDHIDSQDPEAELFFYQDSEGAENSWLVGTAMHPTSGADMDLVDKDKSKVDNNKDEPKDPGESPDSPDPSSAPTEAPVVGIKNLPSVVTNTEAANWYSMNGLGNFFNAGNDWIYQPEMGWCFAKVNQSDLSIWVHNEQFGWMWFPTELPNVTYMVGEFANGWTYFPKSSVTEAGILYDYTNESWLKLK